MKTVFIKVACTATLPAIILGLAGCSVSNHSMTGNPNIDRINHVIPNYKKMARNHVPWPAIPYHKNLMVGARSPIIPEIRKRLIMLGDYSNVNSNATSSEAYDVTMENAVRRFQWRHGLKVDGEIGEKTIAALNVTPAERLHQLQLNRGRWSKIPVGVGAKYIHVNIPNYQFNLVENGEKVINMRVIVGRQSRPTPELYSKVSTLVFNPKWNVPRKIANKDIVPHVLEDPEYLKKNNITIYSSWAKNAYKINPANVDWQKAKKEGFPYRFTQAPGYDNALGQVKFIFMNSHDVYMHDTPQKGLFEKIDRAYSSGCIRLEKPFQLVEYFIQNDPNLTVEETVNSLNNKKIKYVRLKNSIPLYVTYITAWVDRNGTPHFREDIYKRDS